MRVIILKKEEKIECFNWKIMELACLKINLFVLQNFKNIRDSPPQQS